MGEAKRRRKIADHITIYDNAYDAMDRLGLARRGTPVSVMLIGAGLVAEEVNSGGKRLLSRQNSTEVHACRLAFGIWDRIRTGECATWQCTLCRKAYRGLSSLSVFALADDPRQPPAENKHGVMALVCQRCDSVSPDETMRGVDKAFHLMPLPQGGRA
jgi:hypothetical protein